MMMLNNLFYYFSEDVRDLGFTVVIDMRGNSSWTTVKPILKVLQDYFASSIHTAHIIKPDNFWQKQRTNLGSQKYKFEVNILDCIKFYVLRDMNFSNFRSLVKFTNYKKFMVLYHDILLPFYYKIAKLKILLTQYNLQLRLKLQFYPSLWQSFVCQFCF